MFRHSGIYEVSLKKCGTVLLSNQWLISQINASMPWPFRLDWQLASGY